MRAIPADAVANGLTSASSRRAPAARPSARSRCCASGARVPGARRAGAFGTAGADADSPSPARRPTQLRDGAAGTRSAGARPAAWPLEAAAPTARDLARTFALDGLRSPPPPLVPIDDDDPIVAAADCLFYAVRARDARTDYGRTPSARGAKTRAGSAAGPLARTPRGEDAAQEGGGPWDFARLRLAARARYRALASPQVEGPDVDHVLAEYQVDARVKGDGGSTCAGQTRTRSRPARRLGTKVSARRAEQHRARRSRVAVAIAATSGGVGHRPARRTGSPSPPPRRRAERQILVGVGRVHQRVRAG